jgi:type IV pilus assembly protein PilB
MTYENTMTMDAEGIYKKYDSKLQNCVVAETVEALKKSAAAADGLFRVSTTVKKGALPVAYMRLGDLLISAGVIRPEQLNDALAIQKKTRERLGDVLINNGIITEQQLIEALQMQLGVDFVDLTVVSIPLELARFVPRSIAKKYCVVPVKLQKDELYVAMSDPLNFEAQEEIKSASHKQVVPMIATRRAVEQAIATLYGNEGTARAIEEMKREAGSNQADIVPVQMSKAVDNGASEAPTIRFVNSVIERAITERASDIHLEPQEGEMVVRMRIDGVLRRIFTVPANLQATVIARLKIMGGMNIAERKIPQDGRAMVTAKDKEIDLRISSIPTIYGEKIVLRLLDKSSGHINRKTIGLEGEDEKKYDRLLKNSSGVILIVGPTGSGKSTTMCAMIQELCNEQTNIMTLEDPVEYNIPGTNQCQINEKTGMTFAAGLRSILRQDPDVISVGEIRDGETASIAVRAAITGHLVISTLHTNDAVSTISRLVDIGVEPYMISSALRGVVSQRLVRKICPQCRKAYTPTEEEKRMVGIAENEDVTFYKGEGCQECGRTGYRGRRGVFEILTLDAALRREVANNASSEELTKTALENGFVTMKDNCRRLVLEGVTTVSEAAKAINSAAE